MEVSIKRDIFDDDSVYFVALKAIDDKNLKSEMSNIARFYNKKLPKAMKVKGFVENAEVVTTTVSTTTKTKVTSEAKPGTYSCKPLISHTSNTDFGFHQL